MKVRLHENTWTGFVVGTKDPPKERATRMCGAESARLRYVVTRRGASSLVVDGFCYVARKRRGTRVYWSCRSRRALGCDARAVTCAGRLVARAGSHTHAPQTNAVEHHNAIESLIETISPADRTHAQSALKL